MEKYRYIQTIGAMEAQLNYLHLMRDRENNVRSFLSSTNRGRDLFDQLPKTGAYINAKELTSRIVSALEKNIKNFAIKAEYGDKTASREGYYNIENLSRYRELSLVETDLQEWFRREGMEYVGIHVVNQLLRRLPTEIDRELFDAVQVKDQWISLLEEPDFTTDYNITIVLEDLQFSPERIHETIKVEEKEIETGWEYLLDDQGNVAKDTTGNDVKLPVFSTVKATVFHIRQTKAAKLEAFAELTDRQNNPLIHKALGDEIIFDHTSVRFEGDRRALCEETCQLLENPVIPLPSDGEMTIDLIDKIAGKIRYRSKDLTPGI